MQIFFFFFLKTSVHRKGDLTCGTRGRRWGEAELEENGQKVQTSSYTINKYMRCNEQHDDYSNNAVWYTGKLRELILRVLITV